jgi:hypothetical protein
MGGNDAISGGWKRSVDASVVQTTPRSRAPHDYKEKEYNEFNIFSNVYTAGNYNYEMEVVNFDYVSDVSSSDAPPQSVDMNHGLNLGGIDVIRNVKGTKKGSMGLVWSSGTVKAVHRAVERKMKTKVAFKLIGERHNYMWIYGVQLNVKELLIYLIKDFGRE